MYHPKKILFVWTYLCGNIYYLWGDEESLDIYFHVNKFRRVSSRHFFTYYEYILFI